MTRPDRGRSSTTAASTPTPASTWERRSQFPHYTSVLGYDAFHPNTTFKCRDANSSGVVFFPGSSGVYRQRPASAGGFGVSGDGVLQDDVVTAFGIAGFEPPNKLRADQFTLNGIRLPYQNFSRNPDQV